MTMMMFREEQLLEEFRNLSLEVSVNPKSLSINALMIRNDLEWDFSQTHLSPWKHTSKLILIHANSPHSFMSHHLLIHGMIKHQKNNIQTCFYEKGLATFMKKSSFQSSYFFLVLVFYPLLIAPPFFYLNYFLFSVSSSFPWLILQTPNFHVFHLSELSLVFPALSLVCVHFVFF